MSTELQTKNIFVSLWLEIVSEMWELGFKPKKCLMLTLSTVAVDYNISQTQASGKPQNQIWKTPFILESNEYNQNWKHMWALHWVNASNYVFWWHIQYGHLSP